MSTSPSGSGGSWSSTSELSPSSTMTSAGNVNVRSSDAPDTSAPAHPAAISAVSHANAISTSVASKSIAAVSTSVVYAGSSRSATVRINVNVPASGEPVTSTVVTVATRLVGAPAVVTFDAAEPATAGGSATVTRVSPPSASTRRRALYPPAISTPFAVADT